MKHNMLKYLHSLSLYLGFSLYRGSWTSLSFLVYLRFSMSSGFLRFLALSMHFGRLMCPRSSAERSPYLIIGVDLKLLKL